ncbi:hypothetical protein AB0D60_29925 [Streptomyces sp. NPDC048306]|uniref:hypothetical protein n=1 Tax=Streptomyces sp. NPDC048306 TaxID=3154502 RepID=UPI0033D8A155
MCAGVPSASAKSQMFEAVPGFLPDRVRITVLALIVPAVVASRAVKSKRGIARRSPPVRPGRWTGDRVLRPDVGGSEAADRGRAPGRTVAYAEQTCTRGIPGREH